MSTFFSYAPSQYVCFFVSPVVLMRVNLLYKSDEKRFFIMKSFNVHLHTLKLVSFETISAGLLHSNRWPLLKAHGCEEKILLILLNATQIVECRCLVCDTAVAQMVSQNKIYIHIHFGLLSISKICISYFPPTLQKHSLYSLWNIEEFRSNTKRSLFTSHICVLLHPLIFSSFGSMSLVNVFAIAANYFPQHRQ